MSPRTDKQFEEMRQQTIHKINAAALELFSEKGFNSTSVAEIAKNAGISKGLIYNYYKSKEDVLIGVLQGFKKMEEEFNEMINFELDELLNQFFLMLEHQEGLVRMMISFSLDVKEMPVVKEFIHSKIERSMKMYTPLIEKLGFEDPEAETWFLSTLLEGMAIMHIVAKEDYPIEKVKNIIYKRYKINQK